MEHREAAVGGRGSLATGEQGNLRKTLGKATLSMDLELEVRKPKENLRERQEKGYGSRIVDEDKAKGYGSRTVD